MKFLVHAACGLALALSSAPALADIEVRRERVSYRDLDLSSRQGIAALELRVKRAVRRVCRIYGVENWERVERAACIKRAAREAQEQLDQAVAAQRRKNQAKAIADAGTKQPG